MTVQTRVSLGLVPASVDEVRRSIDYICSTEAIDAHGTVLRQKWNLDRFKANPVVLFAHKCREIPIGHAEDVRVTSRGLEARVVYTTEDINPEAERCWKAAKTGLMRGISVGFDFHSYRFEMQGDREVIVFDDLELLELSLCAVPSNPETLAKSADDPNHDVLERLHAERRAQQKTPSPQEKNRMDIEKELEAARASISAKDTELGALRQANGATAGELAQERTSRVAADKLVAERDATIATLSAEGTRLNGVVTALEERATKAEDALTTQEIQARMGKDVDPHEVTHFLALKRSAPALYDAEMKRRTATGRDDKLTVPVIPGDAPGTRGTSTESIDDALARHAAPAV